jgi:hypothetical protein
MMLYALCRFHQSIFVTFVQVLWGALGVALMCNIHGASKRSADGADGGGDDVDDKEDADGWIAESIARAQHCFSTAEKLDPKNVDNLCNFAVFSSEIAGDVFRAKGLMLSCI